MLKKTIKYTDYEGIERTEDFYFNLSKVEVIELQISEAGGYEKMINKIVQEQDSKRIVDIFKDLIFRSYGEKSPDGRRFIKSKELSEAFSQTVAYAELFMELSTNANMAAAFVKGIIPQNMQQSVNHPASE